MAVSRVRCLLAAACAALLVSVLPPLAAAQGSLVFVPNAGQWEDEARFRAGSGPQACWFTDDGWTITLADGSGRGAAVGLHFEGCSPRAPVGVDVGGERHHYFLGGRAVTDVPAFGSLRYEDLYPGIDVVARDQDGRLEYDLCLDPGADERAVIVRCDGITDLTVADDGALILGTALGPLRQPAPVTWQDLPDGRRRRLACRFRRLDSRRFAFELPERDAALPTVIDPGLQWASFLGGSGFEAVQAVVLGGEGTLTVAGFTSTGGFPATAGSYDVSANGGRDVFVSRYSADGTTLLWSTLMGGNKDDEARALALDAAGGAVLAGWTASGNFPTTAGALDTSFNGGAGVLACDAFVARLGPAGNALVFSTYLGGSKDDLASAVVVDGDQGICVAGKTSSAGFPVTPLACDTTYNGGTVDVGDAFVARLPLNGASLVFSTFLGGGGDEFANALALGAGGEVTLAGWTSSASFPTSPGALDRTLQGTSDAFVARLAAGGGSLAFSTLLGGGGDKNATALAIDAGGEAVVAGTTLSQNFPVTPGALQTTAGGGTFYGDGFLARLDATGGSLHFSSYFGGSGDDFPTSLALDGAGGLVLAGWTGSTDHPVSADAADATLGGSVDGTLAVVDADSGALLYGSFLGGSAPDKVLALALAPGGTLALAGYTSSGSFPVTAGAYDAHFDGIEGMISDAFVATLDLGVPGAGDPGLWGDLGNGLPGTAGNVPYLAATGTLLPLSNGVATLVDAAPNAPALLFVSTHAGFAPLLGGTLVPFPYEAMLPYVTDALGGIVIPYEWPTAVPAGHTVFAQAWVVDLAGPQGMSASNALSATAP